MQRRILCVFEVVLQHQRIDIGFHHETDGVGRLVERRLALELAGLAPFDFGSGASRTRPLASIGATYAIGRNQTLGINAVYRREAFQSTGSTSVSASYTIGM